MTRIRRPLTQRDYLFRQKLANNTTAGDVWLPRDAELESIIKVKKDARGQSFVVVITSLGVIGVILKDQLARDYYRFLP